MSKGKWRVSIPGDKAVDYLVGDANVPERVDPEIRIRYLIGTSPNLPETSEFPGYWRVYSRHYVECILDGNAPLMGESDKRRGAKDWNFAKRTDREQTQRLRA